MNSHIAQTHVSRANVFVSYSHQDAGELQRFFGWLESELEGLGIAPDDIFIDKRRTQAGEPWDEERITPALNDATHMIFVASLDSTDARSFCMTRELPRAAERGIPVIVVLLSAFILETKVVRFSGGSLPLSRYEAIPYQVTEGGKGELTPVLQWTHRDQAWTEVLRKIRDTLQDDASVSTSLIVRQAAVPRPRKNHAENHELIAWRCDQQPVVSGFIDGVEGWWEGSLVVFIRGLHDDDPGMFWKRLECYELLPHLERRGWTRDLDAPRPMQWPDEPEDLGIARVEPVESYVAKQLSYALCGERSKLTSPEALRAALGEQRAPRVVRTNAPRHRELTERLVRALTAHLEACGDPQALKNLMVVVTLPDETLFEPALLEPSGLQDFQCVRLVDLERLRPVKRSHVESWLDNESESLGRLGIDRDRLISAFDLAAADQGMRMGPFNKLVQRLSGVRS